MFDRFVKTVAAALMTSNFDKSASFFVRFKKQKVLPTFQKLICKEKKFCVIEPLQSEIRTRYDSLRSLITEPKSAIRGILQLIKAPDNFCAQPTIFNGFKVFEIIYLLNLI